MMNYHVSSSPQTNIIYVFYRSIHRSIHSIHPSIHLWINESNQIKSKKSNQSIKSIQTKSVQSKPKSNQIKSDKTIKSIQTKSVQFKSNQNQTIKLSNKSIIMHHHNHHRYASSITHHVSSSLTINQPSRAPCPVPFASTPQAFAAAPCIPKHTC